MVESFSGGYNPDEGDDFLVEMKKTVNRIESLLRNGKACEFIAVTIPEDMAIQETRKLVDTLGKYEIKVRQLIINNVLGSGDCAFCKERRKEQLRYIDKIKKIFGFLKETIVSLEPREVKGLDALNNFKELLFQ